MQFLQVVNWQKHQHYGQRNPPWIKLYNALLDDFSFNALPEVTRYHLMAIWMLASRTKNRIPNDPAWVQRKVSAQKPVDLDLLIEAGFLESAKSHVEQGVASQSHDASINALASMDSNALSPVEERRGEESSTSYDVLVSRQGRQTPESRPCPQEEIVALYHEILPELPKMRSWNDSMRKSLRARWRESEDRQTMDYWRRFFLAVRRSGFLMGLSEPSPGRQQFQADLAFLVRKEKFDAFRNLKYFDAATKAEFAAAERSRTAGVQGDLV